MIFETSESTRNTHFPKQATYEFKFNVSVSGFMLSWRTTPLLFCNPV